MPSLVQWLRQPVALSDRACGALTVLHCLPRLPHRFMPADWHNAICHDGMQDACERGWFRPPGCADKFNMSMVLQTALEVADAMCYLHAGELAVTWHPAMALHMWIWQHSSACTSVPAGAGS